MPIKDLTGQKFGRLTVIKRDLERTGGAAYWICQCECGSTKSIRGSSLTTDNKSTRSCGCINKEQSRARIDTTSQIGKRYGRLIVIERDLQYPIGHKQESYWKCQCDCGNVITVRLSQLTSEKTRSCGCIRKEQLRERNTIDITGKKFGMLTALTRTEQQTAKGDWMWLCECECGQQVLAATNSLTNGHTQSCGCLHTSLGEYYINKILYNNNIHYVKEYSFADLKSKKNRYLRFDFAVLNDNNIPIRLIEFDGEQHYDKNAYYYTEALEQNDQLKNEYCWKHNIPLVRIPYCELNNLSLDLLMGDKYLI